MDLRHKLDGRLLAACDLVRDGARVADVGTDHGYLICQLVLSGKSPGGVACDIREGPLSSARGLIARLGLSEQVSVRLCDGLSGVEPQEADDIVIAGMGGELIADIVEAAPWLRDPQKRLVLQPMTKVPELRRYLARSGFAILREQGAQAGRFLYTVICAGYTGERRELSEFEALAGKLPESGEALSRAWLRHAAARLRTIGDSLAKSDTDRIKQDNYYKLSNELLAAAGEEPKGGDRFDGTGNL